MTLLADSLCVNVVPNTVYARTAVRAVERLWKKSLPAVTPLAAWEEAVAGVTDSLHSQKEGCPRAAFLGLCEEGYIKDVPAGRYVFRGGQANKGYAVEAVKLLKEQGELAGEKMKLWRQASGGKCKNHQSQMDVVLGLWNCRFSHGSPASACAENG